MPTLFALLASRIALLEQEGLYRYKPELVLAGTGTVVPWYLRYRGTVGTAVPTVGTVGTVGTVYGTYGRYLRYHGTVGTVLGTVS